MDLVKILSERYMKPELPEMNVGDTVRVLVRVKEGNRERTQAFEGTIIAKKHGGINETITVRRISPTVSAARRSSPYTLPPSSLSPPSARARSAEQSSTTCATAWARRPRSRSACNYHKTRRHLPHGRCLFVIGNTAQSSFGASRKNCALTSSLFLEIHKVFLRKTAIVRTQFFSGFALAELCGVAFTDRAF